MTAPHKLFEQKRVRDAMNASVPSVHPEDSACHAAEIMIKLRVSGLPVVDAENRPIGVVSESDFRYADAAERAKQREAWLRYISEGQAISSAYLEALECEADQVRRIMATPAICIDEDASLVEAAEKLAEHRLRRLVVTRDGKVTGIVGRSGLLRYFAPQRPTARPLPTPDEFEAAIEAAGLPAAKPPQPEPAPAGVVEAAELKKLVADYERRKVELKADVARQAKAKRDEAVKELLHAKFTDEEMSRLLAQAFEAARRGETSCVALTFPVALCADAGRAINLPSPDWPASLRGKAADFFLRWESALKPLGYALAARISSFPDGFPGEAELSLVWGRDG
ncbi:CBS domain-containing protein [Rhodoblastus acidophilus]|uniref:CBS domain-containing protein n=1 Tax=Rhodoblastus acidophilus TaxID=1074 RepID=UPI002224AF79|nr:CBS domain-containing protein [Rhodoblastus acidophilus]MCW2285034.1 CBS domain-containing protein [Rhodoblastus acidophilus]MCW2333902.1 CBS domain-containing protein [Rhodoblastus acidophilus]